MILYKQIDIGLFNKVRRLPLNSFDNHTQHYLEVRTEICSGTWTKISEIIGENMIKKEIIDGY